MIAFENINDIEKIIRAKLIQQSQIDGKFVRNSLSLHGEALDKVLNEQIYTSIDKNDVLILFELRSRNNDNDMSETNNDRIEYYKSFEIYVIIYGDNSTNIANNIVARFRTELVRTDLQTKSIYLETISDPTKLNEYKNETMWLRNDISIDIRCKLSINAIVEDYEFDTLNKIEILN